MIKPEFYARQYAAILTGADKAITFIEKGYVEEARVLLEILVEAAEEAYLQATEGDQETPET